jgi:hypothetical protein
MSAACLLFSFFSKLRYGWIPKLYDIMLAGKHNFDALATCTQISMRMGDSSQCLYGNLHARCDLTVKPADRSEHSLICH